MLHEEGQNNTRTRRRLPVRNMFKKRMIRGEFNPIYVDI